MPNHVRFLNNTTDIQSARLHLIHHSKSIRAKFDAQKNGDHTKSGLTFGHRGLVAYNNANQKVIAVGSVDFSATQPKIFVGLSGDDQNGYQLTPGAD